MGRLFFANGNRTQVKIANSSLLTYAQTYASTSNREATYSTTNRLNQFVSGSNTTTYTYNGFGQRIAKQTNTSTTHYDYTLDGNDLDALQLNSDGTYSQATEYIWLDATPIAQIKTVYDANHAVSSRRLTYIHADHLNTPRAMTDSTQKIVWRWDSTTAYGAQGPNTNPDGDSVIDTLDLRFPGQIADSESGLNYNNNRYYDPITGRYTQSDPIGLNGGLNTYAYANNNPISFTDPTGLCVASNYYLCAGIPPDPTPEEKAKQDCLVKCVLIGEVQGKAQEEAAEAAAKAYGKAGVKVALKLVLKTIAWPSRIWDVYQCEKECDNCSDKGKN